MSGFVPFRQGTKFAAGLMDRPAEPVAEDVQRTPAQAPIQSPESAVEEDEAVDGLPQTAADLQALLEEARTEARDAAEAALAVAKDELAAERTALGCLMDSVDRAKHDWSQEVRSQLGEVLLVGVRQIVSESATLQAEALKQRIAEVAERLIGEQQVLLRVRESDVETARLLVGDREGWQVVADDTLASGGCLAETDGGQIDASMGAAFAGLSGSVKEWIESAEEGEE